MTARKCFARDSLHHFSSLQGCPTHSMAVKHNTGRWNLKKYAKKGVFEGWFCGILGPKRGRSTGITLWTMGARPDLATSLGPVPVLPTIWGTELRCVDKCVLENSIPLHHQDRVQEVWCAANRRCRTSLCSISCSSQDDGQGSTWHGHGYGHGRPYAAGMSLWIHPISLHLPPPPPIVFGSVCLSTRFIPRIPRIRTPSPAGGCLHAHSPRGRPGEAAKAPGPSSVTLYPRC